MAIQAGSATVKVEESVVVSHGESNRSRVRQLLQDGKVLDRQALNDFQVFTATGKLPAELLKIDYKQMRETPLLHADFWEQLYSTS